MPYFKWVNAVLQSVYVECYIIVIGKLFSEESKFVEWLQMIAVVL